MNHNIFIPKPAEVISVTTPTVMEKLFEVRLADGTSLGHKPGQFVEVSINGIGEAPISISSPPYENNRFELCIRRAGNVTNAIHRLKQGSKIGIRGPFGSSFPVDKMQGANILFVAGGIGLVPLRSLIKEVLFNREKFKDVTIIYGAKSKDELLFIDEIDEWSNKSDVKTFITVDRPDDEWNGRVGVVTTLFPEIDIDSDNTYVVVVGPPIMYKFVILGLGSKSVPGNRIILSLERRMKCGVGKCGHCQIGSMYVCKDGPVLAYSDIRHMEGVI